MAQPKNLILRIIYQVYFICLGLVLLILASISINTYQDAQDDFNYLLANWNADRIQSVRVTYDQNCSQNEEILSIYHWPGTVAGCDCTSASESDIERNIHNDGTCNSTEIDWGCVSVPEVRGEDFRFIPGVTFDPIIVCGQREINSSFSQTYPTQNNCPDGQLKCGTDQDYFVCTKNTECPVVEFGFNSFKQAPTGAELQPLQADTFWVSRLGDKKSPLVETRVNEGDGVCFKNKQLSITKNREEYPLMENRKVDCERDKRFEQTKGFNELQFYQANSRSNLSDQLSRFIIDTQYQWGFYSRGQVLWKMECRGDFQKLLDSKSNLNHIGDVQTGLLIVSILFFVIVSVICSILAFATMAGFDWPCIKGKGTEESNYIFYIEIVLKVIFQVADAVIIILSYTTVDNQIEFFEKQINNKCSEEYTLRAISELNNNLNKNIQNFNLGILILFIISTIIDIILATYFGYKYVQQRRKKLAQVEVNNSNLEVPYNSEKPPYNNSQPYTNQQVIQTNQNQQFQQNQPYQQQQQPQYQYQQNYPQPYQQPQQQNFQQPYQAYGYPQTYPHQQVQPNQQYQQNYQQPYQNGQVPLGNPMSEENPFAKA